MAYYPDCHTNHRPAPDIRLLFIVPDSGYFIATDGGIGQRVIGHGAGNREHRPHRQRGGEIPRHDEAEQQ